MQERIQLIAFDSPAGRWWFASYSPPPPAGVYVETLWAVKGVSASPRELLLPRGGVEVLFSLGPSHRLLDPCDPSRGTDFARAWVSGLQHRALLVESEDTRNMGISFRPAGAYAFFGLPLSELAGRVVDLDQVLGTGVLAAWRRLLDAGSIEQRFRVLEALVLERVRRGPAVGRGLAWAAEALAAGDGAPPVAAVADRLGLSAKQLAVRFRRQIGTTPKRFARLARFRRVVERVRPGVDWAALAVDCGYYDQAHFIKDFRSFCGTTPGDFLDRRSPDGESLLAS